MVAVTIFGLYLAPLYAAIAQVESDNGRTSPNVYQIDENRTGYIADVNRICHEERFSDADKYSREKSEEMMLTYWAYYGARYERLEPKCISYEVLARIHNGGPDGWKKPSTLPYWNAVKAAMEKVAK